MRQYKRTSIELAVGETIINDFVVLRSFCKYPDVPVTLSKKQVSVINMHSTCGLFRNDAEL